MGVFDYSVDIIIGPKDKAWTFVSNKYGDDEIRPIGNERGMCFCRTGFTPTVWIPEPAVTPRQIGTLAHEALHACIHLMAWAGVKVDEDDDETLCHALAWIVVNMVECGKQRIER